MKNYLLKMVGIILVLSSLINIYKGINNRHYIEYTVTQVSLTSANMRVQEDVIEEEIREIVYDGLTLDELGGKLNRVLNSDLAGYGNLIAELSLEKNVDPIVATSIILHETGCKWKCSYLTRNNYNVGGMRGRNGYMKFSSMEDGIKAFLGNLQKNYYEKGLNTPELINKKYAENPNWYVSINKYVKLIKAS